MTRQQQETESVKRSKGPVPYLPRRMFSVSITVTIVVQPLTLGWSLNSEKENVTDRTFWWPRCHGLVCVNTVCLVYLACCIAGVLNPRTGSIVRLSWCAFILACRRWRAERNFYISFMFLSCSVLANRVRLLLKEMDSLHEQIREMRRR